jgi:hypothetical protein
VNQGSVVHELVRLVLDAVQSWPRTLRLVVLLLATVGAIALLRATT